MARILSNVLTVGAAAMGAAARCAAGAGRDCATGAAAERGAAAVGIGLEADCAAAEGNGTPLDAPVGPPGGNVGNFIVGAAVGLGGRLMRTVSFLGWTLPVDFFIGGGTAPPEIPGLLVEMSSINFSSKR